MYSLSVPKENENDKKLNLEKEIQRLMDQYGDDVLRTSYMFLKDRQRAEDAFQDVFVKIFRKYETFKGESSEKTWIIRITINVCKDILRSSWLKRVLVSDKIGSCKTGLNIEDKYIKKDENRQLFNEVLSLPPIFREVIILFYYHGYDTAEISKISGIAEGTVRSRLYRAREMLKNKLGGRIDRFE